MKAKWYKKRAEQERYQRYRLGAPRRRRRVVSASRHASWFQTPARRGATLLRRLRRGGRGVAPRAWEPVTNRAIRFERVAVTSTPVTGGNWASRGRGVVARHSGRDGTPDWLRSDAAVCSWQSNADGRRLDARTLSAYGRTIGHWGSVPLIARVRTTSGDKGSERTDHLGAMSQTELDETAVENFREYLRIPSVQPDVNYGERSRGACVIWDSVRFSKNG